GKGSGGGHRVREEEPPRIERHPPVEGPGPVAHPKGGEVSHSRADVPPRQDRVPGRLLPLVHRPRDQVCRQPTDDVGPPARRPPPEAVVRDPVELKPPRRSLKTVIVSVRVPPSGNHTSQRRHRLPRLLRLRPSRNALRAASFRSFSARALSCMACRKISPTAVLGTG